MKLKVLNIYQHKMVKTNEHLAQVIIGSIHHQIMLDVT
jgi:hypothetical protein